MNNILDKKDYIITNNVPDIELNEQVVAFNDGINWHAVSLKLMHMYPIIHISFNDSKINVVIPMSLLLCPYTCFTAVFESTLSYKNNSVTQDENGFIEIVDENNNEVNLLDGSVTIDGTSENVKRFEVNLMTLRDMVTLYANIKFVVPIKNNKHPEPVVDLSYLKEKLDGEYVIHPKTLIYIIEYKSTKSEGYKQTILVGSGTSYDNSSGFNINKNGVTKYMTTNDTKIRQKSGFIYPIFWFVAKKMFPDANVIKL